MTSTKALWRATKNRPWPEHYPVASAWPTQGHNRPAVITFPKLPVILWPGTNKQASFLGAALSFFLSALNCGLSPLIYREIFGLFPRNFTDRDTQVSRRTMDPVSRGSPWANGKTPYDIPSTVKDSDNDSCLRVAHTSHWIQERRSANSAYSSQEQGWALGTKVIFQFWYDYIAFFSVWNTGFNYDVFTPIYGYVCSLLIPPIPPITYGPFHKLACRSHANLPILFQCLSNVLPVQALCT